jgi:DNA topoisomerase VI subunit B
LDKTVKSFFKSDLTEIQFQKIEEIVEKYNNNKNILEKKLIQASKDLLDTTIEINEELKNLRK